MRKPDQKGGLGIVPIGYRAVTRATAPSKARRLSSGDDCLLAQAPICACFGFGREEIEADIQEGGVRRTRDLVEKAGSPAAHCTTASASGHSCVPDVQRYYMKHRNPSQA